jgi:hypothetical protein
MKEATANGLKVQITLTGVAANWGNACGKSTGSNPSVEYWKTFVAKYVQFFYARGARRFSLWNEPNLPSFLCAGNTVTGKDVDHSKCSTSPAKNAALYYRLYSSGYKVIRTMQKQGVIGRDAKIWIGEYAGAGGVSFTSRMLKKYKIKADGFSWHPYQYCTPPTTKGKSFVKGLCRRAMGGIGYVRDVKRQLTKWAKAGRLTTPKGKPVPMYLTEFGYHRKGAYGIPEKYRASWYPKALEFARKAGVKGFVLYQFYPQAQAWDTSVLEANGKPTPSFLKLWKWAQKRKYKVKKIYCQ